jgi:deoxyxylulose-5-phosphate synthase
VLNVGYPDEFVKHGTVSDIEKKYGMDVQSIVKRVCEFLK